MEIHTLASGSSGNCLLASAGGAHVLIDAGISCRRVTTALAALGVRPEELAGVLITHEHTDHVSGLATLTKKYALPVYTSPGTARRLCYRIAALEDLVRPVAPGDSLNIGPFGVETFPTSHDAAQPMGFALTHGGRKAAVVTDLGYVTDEVRSGVQGAHLLVCEANHDVDWLESGSYPYYLKARILGNKGHLSNEAGAALACWCVEAGAATVLLAHLSAENNTPARALQVAQDMFRRAGIDPERDVVLSAAPRGELSPAYSV